MRSSFSVAGISFRPKEEIGQLRPAGLVEIVPEPDNPYDSNALAVMWQGHHLGYVPSGKSKFPRIQAEIMSMIIQKKPFTVEVERYGYRDGETWNDNHVGHLGSVALCLCTEGDGNVKEKDGKTYGRISHFLDCFKPDGIEGLMRWGINGFKNYQAYEAYMADVSAKGTAMHAALEQYFKKEACVTQNLPDDLGALQNKYKIEPISFEERLYDDDLMLSGQYDMLANVDGEPTIIDWKSGKSVRPQHRLQASFYAANKARELDGKSVSAMVVSFGNGLKVWRGTPRQVDVGYAIVASLSGAVGRLGEM